MSEVELKPDRNSPSIPEVGGDPASHTRVLQAMRETVMIGVRHTGDIEQSFVRVSELVALGIAELQGGRLLVRVDTATEDTGTSSDIRSAPIN